MLDKVEQNIVDHVDRVGWSIMKVAPRANSDEPKEWFAYTIGLPQTFGWPEIICFGLNIDLMHELLNDAVKVCRDRGCTPAHGMLLEKVIKGAPVKLIDAKTIPDHYLGYARWFAEHVGIHGPVVRLQMLWPDRNGQFPDNGACDDGTRVAQTPILVS